MARRRTVAARVAEQTAAKIEERRAERLARSRVVLAQHKHRWLKRFEGQS